MILLFQLVIVILGTELLINLIVAGENYGWPISSYGEHYGFPNPSSLFKYKNAPLHKSHKKYGFEEPVKQFLP